MQRALVDPERALKNDYSEPLGEFIRDSKRSFTDKQVLKALNVLCTERPAAARGEREKLTAVVFSGIQAGNFEFRRGNTLASFAQTFRTLLELSTRDSRSLRVPFDIMTGK
jgi:hypothetical protein